ncbi:MAG TPA: zinc ribbon domain-containing protein [Longimicrobiales bacterium]|nr:zinc ribbon domain-containing protein [Longimicrobiales bacterium]
MPTYEYRCSNGHQFEQFQRMSEEPVKVCTVCGAPAERQLSSGAGLIFKGSGFYITDYRSDSYKKDASADKAPGSGDAGGGKASSGGSGGSKDTGSPAPSSTPATPKGE